MQTSVALATRGIMAIVAMSVIDIPARANLIDGISAQANFSVFATGFNTPETISLAPAAFGTHGGRYFVPNPNNQGGASTIRVVPPGGGPSSTFATVDFSPTGGLFLPDSFGTRGGQYVAVGFSLGSTDGQIRFFNANGAVTGSIVVPNVLTTTPVIAPGSFGPFGGQLIISDQSEVNATVIAMSPNGSIRTIVGGLPIDVFGLEFAPAGFGRFEGMLLANDEETGRILAISSNGSFEPFTTIPIASGQRGLRQMAFVPNTFGDLGGLLLVSVSGSQLGGGTLGSLLALNSIGDIVSTLKIGSEVDAFDPRGLYFTADGRLLVSDASVPGKILALTPSDFTTPVPEPSSLVLLGIGGLCLLGYTRGYRRRAGIAQVRVGSAGRTIYVEDRETVRPADPTRETNASPVAGSYLDSLRERKDCR